MKKSKVAIAVLAAAVMTTGALGLAACSKGTASGTQSGTIGNVTPNPATTEYTVTFDANGGAIDGAYTKAITTSSGKIAELPTAEYEDHTFVKWTVDEDGEGDEFTVSTSVTANMTVYAQWTSDDDDGGDGDRNVLADGIYVNGTSIGALTPNTGNSAEVMLDGGEMQAGQSFKLVYKGAYVTDFTVKADSTSRISHTVAADGSVSVITSGNFEFYYTFGTKILYVGAKANKPLDSAVTTLEVGKYYVVGDIADKGMKWSNTNDDSKGLPMSGTSGSITVTLTIGAEDSFKFICASTSKETHSYYNGNSSNAADAVFHFADAGNIRLKQGQTGGTYTFTLNTTTGAITYTAA